MHVHSATLCSPFWIEELRAKQVAAFECLGPVGPSHYYILWHDFVSSRLEPDISEKKPGLWAFWVSGMLGFREASNVVN